MLWRLKDEMAGTTGLVAKTGYDAKITVHETEIPYVTDKIKKLIVTQD